MDHWPPVASAGRATLGKRPGAAATTRVANTTTDDAANAGAGADADDGHGTEASAADADGSADAAADADCSKFRGRTSRAAVRR